MPKLSASRMAAPVSPSGRLAIVSAAASVSGVKSCSRRGLLSKAITATRCDTPPMTASSIAKVAIVTEVCRTLTSGLHDDGQRQRLPECAFFNPHSLRNAVICEDEIVRCKRKDNLCGLAFYQYRHKHQIRSRGESRELRVGKRRFFALSAGCLECKRKHERNGKSEFQAICP